MSAYISKQEAIEAFSDMSDGTPITHGDVISDTTAVNVIKSIPSADVRENIHAYWIKDEALSVTIDMYRCSNCSSMAGALFYNFCPKCGAIMDGEPKGEKGTE